MFDSRIIRRLGWIALLFPVLIVAAISVIRDSLPMRWNVSGQEIIRHYAAHNGSELTSFYFFASGLTVFTLVAVSLAAALKALTDSTILPYSVIAGAAILFGGGAASGAADLGLIEGAKRGIPVGTAETFQAMNSTVTPLAFQVGGAIVAVAVGLGVLIANRGWRWAAWILIVVGLSLVLGQYALPLFPLALVLVSFAVARIYDTPAIRVEVEPNGVVP